MSVVEINSGKTIGVLGDSFAYTPTASERYSVRCGTKGAIFKVDFVYDGVTHTEWSEDWWMRGDRNGDVYSVDYLASCGPKKVQIRGSVASGVCFDRTFSFKAKR